MQNNWVRALLLLGAILILGRFAARFLSPSASQEPPARQTVRTVQTVPQTVPQTAPPVASQQVTQPALPSTSPQVVTERTTIRTTTEAPVAQNPQSPGTGSSTGGGGSYDRATSLNQAGNYQEAIEELNLVLAENPDFAEAYYNRGYARGQLGNYQGAIQDFNQAIQRKPDYPEAYYSRGVARARLGNEQSALADYRQAAELYRQQGRDADYRVALNAVDELQSLPILW